MAEQFDVYDASNALIGEIPISAQQRAVLHAGGTISISYHTPRMLREAIPQSNGTFDVFELDGRLFVSDVEQVKRYAAMQLDIARAMKQPEKWTDPDAKSDSPIR